MQNYISATHDTKLFFSMILFNHNINTKIVVAFIGFKIDIIEKR